MVQSYGYFAIYANFAHHKGFTRGSGTPPCERYVTDIFPPPPHKQPYQGRNPRSERKTINLSVTRKKKPESEANVCGGG